MTHIITSLCLRHAACMAVCPVECIVPGTPESAWPWMYIDPDTCIDCGACIPECPYGAIFPEDDVPAAYQAKSGERLNAPLDSNFSARATEHYEGEDYQGSRVVLEQTVTLLAGEIVNLR
ncbi:MAG: ferredoxin family protein [Chloroflexota bacterium]|nr:ferredoxin family protein [Chloroflexota bacterium]